MMSTDDSSAILHELRAWRHYLMARQTLQDTQDTPDRHGSMVFERTSPDGTVTEAETMLAGLERNQRRLFDAVVDAEVAEARTAWITAHPKRTPNANDLLSHTIATLLKTVVEPDGQEEVYVPRGSHEQWEYWKVPYAETIALPQESAYEHPTEGQTRRRNQRRNMWFIGGIASVCVVWIVIGGVLHWTRPPATVPVAAVQVNGVAVQEWPVHHVTLLDTAGEVTVGQPLPDHAAYPLVVCSSRLDMTAAGAESSRRPDTVTVHSTPPYPTRVYQIDPVATMGDVQLTACDGIDGSVGYWGELITTHPAITPGVLGDRYPIAETDLVVQNVRIIGRDRNPSLPEHEAIIEVITLHQEELPWRDLVPVLVLPSGDHLSAATTQAIDGGTRFWYQVPAPQHPLSVVWLIPDTPQSYGWSVTLAPPTPRADYVAQALQIEEPIQVAHNRTGTHVEVTFVVRNTHQEPIQLIPEDVLLRVQEVHIPTPDITLFHEPLTPGETRTGVLTVPMTGAQDVFFTLGTYRYRIHASPSTTPEGRGY